MIALKEQEKKADGRYRLRVGLPSGKIKYVYGNTKEELEQKREDMLLQYAQKQGDNIEG